MSSARSTRIVGTTRMAQSAPAAQSSIKEVAVIDQELLTAMTVTERAWAPVYERLFSPCCRSAARLLGKDAAHDVVQEALLEIFRKWNTLTPDERTDKLIRQHVRFRVLDERRRQRRRVEYTEELEEQDLVPLALSPDAILSLDDAAVMVDRIIATMPPQRRSICLLVYEDGVTIRQAAAELGIAFETARTHMKLAHLYLRKHLAPLMEVDRLEPGTIRCIPRITDSVNNPEARND